MTSTKTRLQPDSRSFTTQWLRQQLFKRFSMLEQGQVTLVEGNNEYQFGDEQAPPELCARVIVLDPKMYRFIAFGGTVGAGESYMEGHWEAEDLTAVIRVFVRNKDTMNQLQRGLARLSAPVLQWLHKRNRNTRDGSARNIAAHYDLGNDFFALFLDRNMMYSSAVYRDPQETLETASDHKLDRICRKLELKPGDNVLEIGTGWGGFAIFAASHYGCHVTTTTISQEQHDQAKRRIEDAGLTDRITLLKKDYRDLDGQFDKLVSIEMIEAVGHHYLDTYIQQCAALLKPDGMFLLQAITIQDQLYDQAIGGVDFIQRYIFPGSFIPSINAICSAVARVSDLRLFHLEDIGPSYALTLREWRRRFLSRLDEVRQQGYPETFIRMWEYYLCYCEGGFLERSIGNAQMLLTKPGSRRESLVPAL
ncbi:MAG: cyclopropane-fatty-acyl-phospholipid synthase family protein [Pseudomonadota bacterium]